MTNDNSVVHYLKTLSDIVAELKRIADAIEYQNKYGLGAT